MTEEAKWIIDNLPIPEKGVFCEIGSFDGVEGSNTLPFEEKGWTGLCIEGDPLNAWKCVENRKCMTLCAAIGEPPPIMGAMYRFGWFTVNLEDRGLSGLKRDSTGNKDQIIVPVVALREILNFLKIKTVDLLSIDTEGTEIEVWRSIGTIRPKIVIVEYYTLGKPRNDREVLNEMLSCGYKMVWENHLNMIFTYDK